MIGQSNYCLIREKMILYSAINTSAKEIQVCKVNAKYNQPWLICGSARVEKCGNNNLSSEVTTTALAHLKLTNPHRHLLISIVCLFVCLFVFCPFLFQLDTSRLKCLRAWHEYADTKRIQEERKMLADKHRRLARLKGGFQKWKRRVC